MASSKLDDMSGVFSHGSDIEKQIKEGLTPEKTTKKTKPKTKPKAKAKKPAAKRQKSAKAIDDLIPKAAKQEKKKVFAYTLTPSHAKKLKQIAKKRGYRSSSALLDELLGKILD